MTKDHVWWWEWYCDVHDTFGTGDSEDEVDALANTHNEVKANLEEVDFDECCSIVLYQPYESDAPGKEHKARFETITANLEVST